MEESLRALYMGFSAVVFVIGITMLIMLQNTFDSTYERLVEVINGGFIW